MGVLSATVLCLALNIFHEARGEPRNGRMEVAKVTLNRARERGTDVCTEVKRPHQFSWYAPGTKLEAPMHEPKIWKRSISEARRAIKIHRFVRNKTLYYHNHTVSPKWAKRVQIVWTVGNHTFYRPYE